MGSELVWASMGGLGVAEVFRVGVGVGGEGVGWWVLRFGWVGVLRQRLSSGRFVLV